MQVSQDFIVIDTEGKNELSEIAIINNQGQLIYEAFARGHPSNDSIKYNVKTLREIVVDFLKIAQAKLVICHNTGHDIRVLKYSFRKAGIGWQTLNSGCTCEQAKVYFQGLSSYSLEYLSKYLNLKVNNKHFNTHQAHTARYDAEFTYQLYLKIMEQSIKIKLLQTLRDKPNPFGSSRVDTPFQDHLDLKEIYQSEFSLVKSIITEIKYDKNYQSKGAIVIGEPGTGKTHLIMRLAKELLKVNRLLFVRSPNNPDSVLYHIYSRILESFIEKVPGSPYTQLEHLLANSFVKLICETRVMILNKKDQDILSTVRHNNLSLYENLGAEGADKKRAYWQHIEKRTHEWWVNQYGIGGYSAQIVKGIIKFCSYSDPRRKEVVTRWLSANELTPEEAQSIGLDNWHEEMSKEEFSLQAISVFSRLSLLDEPLIIAFDQLEALGLEHNRGILLSFGEAVKEIFTHVPNSLIVLNLFPERWEQFKEVFDGAIVDRVSQYKIRLQKPSPEKLKEILELKAQTVGVTIETLFDSAELEIILNQNSIRKVLNTAADYYRFKVNHLPLPISESPKNLVESETVYQRLEKLESELSHLQRVVNNITKAMGIPSHLNDEELKPNVHLSDKVQSSDVSNKSTESPEEIVLRYLQEQRALLEQDYTKPKIISDNDDIGKLISIAEEFKKIKAFGIDYLRLGRRTIPEHLVIRNQNQSFAVAFLQVDGGVFTNRLKNFNELVISHKETQFLLLRDRRQREITGKVGKEEIEKLRNTPNCSFVIMDKENRITFELIYKLITDIQNRDFDVGIEVALQVLISYFKSYWLIKIFHFERI